ncbi:MAG: protein translocase subunit SecF, partial [Nocardioidaceae bacterium]
MGRLSTLGQRLYTGKVSYDFVGRRRIWYTISAIIVVFAASGLLVKGINQGVEFRGGVEFTAQIEPTDENVDEIRTAVIDSGVEVGDPIVTTSGNDAIRIQVEPLNTFESAEVRDAILATGASDVSLNQIGPQWGQEVADSAIRGLVIFVGLV